MDEATAQELERLEKLLLDPAVRRERARVAALLTEGFFEFGSSGRVWTREATLDLLTTESYSPPEVEEFGCRELSEGVVLATYRAVRVGTDGNRAVTLRCSLWTRASGAWQMCFHQGTKVG